MRAIITLFHVHIQKVLDYFVPSLITTLNVYITSESIDLSIKLLAALPGAIYISLNIWRDYFKKAKTKSLPPSSIEEAQDKADTI